VRHDAGEVRRDHVLLQLRGLRLVLQVLEQDQGDREIAHRVEAEDHDGARDGADAAAELAVGR
jgi:hypothetical protein